MTNIALARGSVAIERAFIFLISSGGDLALLNYMWRKISRLRLEITVASEGVMESQAPKVF